MRFGKALRYALLCPVLNLANPSQFWKGFFEASANVKLTSYEEPAEGEETLEEDTMQGYMQTTPPTQTPGSEVEEDATRTTATTSSPGDTSARRYRRTERPTSSSTASSSPIAFGTPPAQTSTGKTSNTSGAAAGFAEEASFADYPSPYETLKQEMSGTTRSRPGNANTRREAGPSTPRIPVLQRPSRGAAQAPDSSPFLAPPTTTFMGTTQQLPAKSNVDPLLHRVLDKNYRIQATPLTTRRQAAMASTTRAGTASAQKPSTLQRPALLDFSSPFSPPVAAPQLRSEIFGSPVRASVPRTPGVSVQKSKAKPGQFGYLAYRGRTPRGALAEDTANIFGDPSGARGAPKTEEARTATAAGQRQQQPPQARQIWDSDSDDNFDDGAGNTLEELGMSPPKTLQFHIPASRLLRTPAREASKRIVEDLMLTAGMEVGAEESTLEGVGAGKGKGRLFTDDDDDVLYGLDEEEDADAEAYGRGVEEDSPSVVRVMRRDADADAF